MVVGRFPEVPTIRLHIGFPYLQEGLIACVRDTCFVFFGQGLLGRGGLVHLSLRSRLT